MKRPPKKPNSLDFTFVSNGRRLRLAANGTVNVIVAVVVGPVVFAFVLYMMLHRRWH